MKKHIETIVENGSLRCVCRGDWTIYTAAEIEKSLKRIDVPKCKSAEIDFEGVGEFDSTGILLLLDLQEQLRSRCGKAGISGLNTKQKKMISIVSRQSRSGKLPSRREGLLHNIGKATIEEFKAIGKFMAFTGEVVVSSLRLLKEPHNFRFRETIYHIEKSGFNSLFIVGLTSMLIGLVLAYQGLVQLSRFGADIYIVESIGIAMTRELGPMITAIVIAGRSASSYTAEIGTMKITEEINAMRTMGFDPYFFLVLPRLVALSISMPLIIFFSDIVGIVSGMVISNLQVDISYSLFLDRLQQELGVNEYILGMIKGPFFALIIAATGCFHGFRVTRDTESIGIETTASVVHAIFFVIACDAIFSVIYTELGL